MSDKTVAGRPSRPFCVGPALAVGEKGKDLAQAVPCGLVLVPPEIAPSAGSLIGAADSISTWAPGFGQIKATGGGPKGAVCRLDEIGMALGDGAVFVGRTAQGVHLAKARQVAANPEPELLGKSFRSGTISAELFDLPCHADAQRTRKARARFKRRGAGIIWQSPSP